MPQSSPCPYSFLPTDRTRPVTAQAHNAGGTLCSRLHRAPLGPFHRSSSAHAVLLPEHGMSFHASKHLCETLSLPWNALVQSPFLVTQLLFLFSSVDSHVMSQGLDSPLGRASQAFSWDAQQLGPLRHHQHMLTSVSFLLDHEVPEGRWPLRLLQGPGKGPVHQRHFQATTIPKEISSLRTNTRDTV